MVNLQSNIITAILQWRIIFGLLLVILVTICSPLINTYIFENPVSLLCYGIAFANVFFSQLLVKVLKIHYAYYLGLIVILFCLLHQSALAAILILTFVIYFNYDIKGYFLGLLISSATLSLLGWYYIREYNQFQKIPF